MGVDTDWYWLGYARCLALFRLWIWESFRWVVCTISGAFSIPFITHHTLVTTTLLHFLSNNTIVVHPSSRQPINYNYCSHLIAFALRLVYEIFAASFLFISLSHIHYLCKPSYPYCVSLLCNVHSRSYMYMPHTKLLIKHMRCMCVFGHLQYEMRLQNLFENQRLFG